MPVPVPAPAPHPNDLIAAIAEDHKKINDHYDKYNLSAGDTEDQGRWARKFIWEVAQHIVGEELVVYPLMEQYLEVPGRMFADEDREVHQKVKTLLHDVESHKAGSPEQADILKSVMEYLRPHNDREVQRDLPLLTNKMSDAASVKAAASFRRTKKIFGPTRTHPGAPSRPPLGSVVSFLETPIDIIRDLFAKFPKDLLKNPLIDAIADDRREIHSYYDQYVKSHHDGDVDAQDSWARQLIWDVARHIVGVELVVHPLMVSYLGDPGKIMAHDGHIVYQNIRALLFDIESHNYKPDSQEHVGILKSVMEHLRHHNDNEVKRDLPLLVEAMGAANFNTAKTNFEKTKMFAPSHADPDMHNSLPFETSAALMRATIAELQLIFANPPVANPPGH